MLIISILCFQAIGIKNIEFIWLYFLKIIFVKTNEKKENLNNNIIPYFNFKKHKE